MANINLPGPVGNYVETTTYNIGDIVRDTTNGRTWMSRIDNNTMALPTDLTGSDQWQLMARDGEAGQVNTNNIAITIDRPDESTANPERNSSITAEQLRNVIGTGSEWSANNNYISGDSVVYGNAIFQARTNITGNTNSSNEVALNHFGFPADIVDFTLTAGGTVQYIQFNLNIATGPMANTTYSFEFAFTGTRYTGSFQSTDVMQGGQSVPNTSATFSGGIGQWYVAVGSSNLSPSAPSGGFDSHFQPDNASVHLRASTHITNSNPGVDTTRWLRLSNPTSSNNTTTSGIIEWESGNSITDGQLYYYRGPNDSDEGNIYRANSDINGFANTTTPDSDATNFKKVGETIVLAGNAAGTTYGFGSIVIDSDAIRMFTGSTPEAYDTNDDDWVVISGGGMAGATALGGLTDVTITNPANGQVLSYNGTNWVNTTNTASGVTEIHDWAADEGYVTDQVVVYNDVIFRALNDITANASTSTELPLDTTHAGISFENFLLDNASTVQYIRLNLVTGGTPTTAPVGTDNYTMEFVYRGVTYDGTFDGGDVRLGGTTTPGTASNPFTGDNRNWYILTSNVNFTTPSAPSGGFDTGTRPDNSTVHLRRTTHETNTNPGADTTNWERISGNNTADFRVTQPKEFTVNTQTQYNALLRSGHLIVDDVVAVHETRQVHRVTGIDPTVGVNAVELIERTELIHIDGTARDIASGDLVIPSSTSNDVYLCISYVNDVTSANFNTHINNFIQLTATTSVNILFGSGFESGTPAPTTGTTIYGIGSTETTNVVSTGNPEILEYNLGTLSSQLFNQDNPYQIFNLLDMRMPVYQAGTISSQRILQARIDALSPTFGNGWQRVSVGGVNTIRVNYNPANVRQGISVVANLANALNDIWGQVFTAAGQTNPWTFTAERNGIIHATSSDNEPYDGVNSAHNPDGFALASTTGSNTGTTEISVTVARAGVADTTSTQTVRAWTAVPTSNPGGGVTGVTTMAEATAQQTRYNIIHINSTSDLVDTSQRLRFNATNFPGAAQLYHGGTANDNRVVVQGPRTGGTPILTGDGVQVGSQFGGTSTALTGAGETLRSGVFNLDTADTSTTSLGTTADLGRRAITLQDGTAWPLGLDTIGATSVYAQSQGQSVPYWLAFVNPNNDREYVILGPELYEASGIINPNGDASGIVIDDGPRRSGTSGSNYGRWLQNDTLGIQNSVIDRVAEFNSIDEWHVWKMDVPTATTDQEYAELYFNSFESDHYYIYKPFPLGSNTNQWTDLNWE